MCGAVGEPRSTDKNGRLKESAPLAAAATGACPRCGGRTLFEGWVRFAPRCRACGLGFAACNVGDGPAAFLILILGALLTAGALIVDAAFEPYWWVHLVWLPVGVALTIFGLRFGEAWLLGQECRHRAGEGRFKK